MSRFPERPPYGQVAGARFLGLVFAVTLAATCGALAAATTIWTNSENQGNAVLQQWNLTTGSLLTQINVPPAGQSRIGGRGIVQIGDVLYYTSRSSNRVFKYNFVTHTDLGTAFAVNIAGVSFLSAIAFDGSSFYIQDYTFTNRVFKYSQSGVYQATLHLSGCTSSCDGIEYANGKLISNRGDSSGPYDVYSLAGALQTPQFILDPNHQSTTGIAFDGTTYFVVRIWGGNPFSQILKFNSSGTFLSALTLANSYAVEDISVNSEWGQLKLCKVAGPGVATGQPFTFSLAAAGSATSTLAVPAGPALDGSCVLGPAYRTGSTVTISEHKPGGNFSTGWASDIAAAPPARLLSSTLSQGLGSPYQGIANVMIGSGVTEATFANTKPGLPSLKLYPSAHRIYGGYLEICKVGDVHGDFRFTVTGVAGIVTVSAGACSPMLNPPAGNVVITELPAQGAYWLPGACCTTFPADRQVAHDDALQTSTVSVVAGDPSTETIAYIRNTLN